MKTSLSRLKGRTVQLSVAVALAAISATAAQAQEAPAQQPAQIQEVVVTGSRIAAPNQTSASPVQVVSAQDILNTGKTDISDILYQMPQLLNNDLGQDFSNRTPGLSTPGGVTTADLRGLGPNRTLVLIDGRRLGQGSPQTTIASPAPDLDQIPTALIERVEVLTGGASSTYGSDAIAGVVNFIMKKNFQGVQIDGQYGIDWHKQHNSYMDQTLPKATPSLQPLTGDKWDGKNKNLSILVGTNFADGNGNVTAYLTYNRMDPVASSERDFGQCQLTETTDAAGNVTGNACSGSSNANRFTPLKRPGYVVGPNVNTRYAVLGTSFVPWSSKLAGTNPPTIFNSQPFIYMQRDDTRYLAGFMAHDDISESVKPYMEFGFMNDRTSQFIAPAAAFTTGNPNTGGPYYVNCGNPFLSAQEVGILGCTPAQVGAANQADPANQVPLTIGRRNVEGGPRSTDYEHTNYRWVVGVKGDFADAWSYDTYGQYYYVNFRSVNNNYLSYQKIGNALLATRNAKGNIVCLAPAPCVPWNIFADGGVSQTQLDYLYLLGTTQGANSLRTFHADITGDLGKYGVKLPSANDGLGINFGFEHRKETVKFIPDDATNSGQLSGAGGTEEPLNNSIGVSEEFIEARLPIAQDKPGAKDLVLSGGFRRSDYSVSGAVNTYKVDLVWAPIADIKFRGSYQRAIRAPSVSELFDPQNIGLIQYGNDPCAAPAAYSLAQCLNTLKSINPTAAQVQAFQAAYGNGTTTNTIPQAISGQLGQVQGGYPQLQPETSKSYSVGMTFQPTAVPNLTGSIDWWQIRINGEVGTYPASVLVTDCLQTGNPTFCSQVVRTQTDFSLSGATVATGGYILQTNQNIASVLQSGIDLQASYKMNMGNVGSLLWQLTGSYLLHATTKPLPDGGSYDCAGLFGLTCQTINSRWRHNLRATWQTPAQVDVSLNWRFIGKVGDDNNDPNPLLTGNAYGAYDYVTKQLPNMNYIDLSAAWHATSWLDLRGGINNLFDRDPPLIPVTIQPGGAANTYGTYDVLGRQLYVSFTAKF